MHLEGNGRWVLLKNHSLRQKYSGHFHLTLFFYFWPVSSSSQCCLPQWTHQILHRARGQLSVSTILTETVEALCFSLCCTFGWSFHSYTVRCQEMTKLNLFKTARKKGGAGKKKFPLSWLRGNGGGAPIWLVISVVSLRCLKKPPSSNNCSSTPTPFDRKWLKRQNTYLPKYHTLV